METTECLQNFGQNLLRRKPTPRNPLASDLKRCLGLTDLTYLSIGAMIGVGVYVTMGELTKEAGPSIVLSYFLAGVASVLSALCYAELASRYPIAGSSYQFTYMTIGEVWGFFVGWNIALEHAITSAAVSRGVSGYIDGLFGNVIKNYLVKHTPMPGGFIATYPDFLSAAYVTIIVILIAFGIKLSSRANIFFATLNIFICGFIIVSAMILGKASNWSDVGHGGFFPNGFSATLSGAATLIFAYIGYEVVGAAAEEAENPRRDIPLSLILSISIVMLIYTSVAASYVSIVPWYNASVDAPFTVAYEAVGWYWPKYVITVGIIVASSSATIAATFAVSRYLFSMARDGLLMEFLGKVNPVTQVPVYATIAGGFMCVFMTIIFSLRELVDFMSIGQLIACIFVAFCVIRLRYIPFEKSSDSTISDNETTLNDVEEFSKNDDRQKMTEETSLINCAPKETPGNSSNCEFTENTTGTIYESIQESKYGYLFEWTKRYNPGNVPVFLLVVAMLFSASALAMFLFASTYITEWWFIILSSLFCIITVASIIFMMMFVQDKNIETYKIHYAPFTPFVSIVINIALMMKLDIETWMRLGVWMIVGFVLYFGYGYSHSKARKNSETIEEAE